MTEHTLNDENAARWALTRECPYCHAAPGEPCVLRRGAAPGAPYIHGARTQSDDRDKPFDARSNA
jgi:hypothetical protein